MPNLLVAVAGTISKERNLHRQFDHLRLHGEWFQPGDDLIQYIESIKES